jgi:SAM-dependent methyltransferase
LKPFPNHGDTEARRTAAPVIDKLGNEWRRENGTVATDKSHLKQLMERPEFPRSNTYDPEWVIENRMGLNALWLTEWLCQKMRTESGMRVLDLGCGRAMSSIFLAKEFGVEVWATDLWIEATDNRERIDKAGLSDKVFPIHADARSLPYAQEFFDAIVMIDSGIYFATDDLYLKYLHGFVRKGGHIGAVMNCSMREINAPVPTHLKPFWDQDCWSWHDVEWWRKHWGRTGLVDIKVADTLPDGCKIWLQFNKARMAAGNNSQSLKTDIEVMERDRGEYMGWGRVIAERPR